MAGNSISMVKLKRYRYILIWRGQEIKGDLEARDMSHALLMFAKVCPVDATQAYICAEE